MRRKLYLTLMIAFLASYAIHGQVHQVPVSAHDTHQFVQGPCYIFATMAALETAALNDNANCVDPYSINFNEWSFYSKGVIDDTFSGPPMIKLSLQHMATIGAKHLEAGLHPQRKIELPNHNRGNLASDLTGNAEFTSTSGTCGNWADNHKYYVSQFSQLQPGGSPPVCYDVEANRSFKFVDNGTSTDIFHFRNADGSVINNPSSHSNLPLTELEVGSWSQSQIKNKVAEILDTGHGVIMFFSKWKDNVTEHAIYVYKYEESSGRFWYKDSWPQGAGGTSNGPEFILPSSAGVSLNTKLGDAIKIMHLTGTVRQSPAPTVCTNCQESISRVDLTPTPTFIDGVGEFEVSGSPSVVSWSVSDGLEIVGSSTSGTVKVLSRNCNFFDTTQETITAVYDFGCVATYNVTDLRSSQAVEQIKLNGPSGFHNICPGDVIQLEAVADYYPHPQYTFEWLIGGATIINGQGSKFLNIQISSAANSTQVYKVRTYDALCGWYSPWKTLSGNVNNSNCGGGGLGGPGSGLIGPTSNQMDFTDFFEDTPRAKTVQIEIYTMEGKRLLKGEVNANEPIQSLKLVPRGIAIFRLYSPETGEFRSFKHLLKD